MSATPAFDLGAARRMYWAFHWGVPPDAEFVVRGAADLPEFVAQLGTVAWLELADGRKLVVDADGPDVILATSRYGQDLYLVAESGVIGEFEPGHIEAIAYETNKGRGQVDTWRHAFHGALDGSDDTDRRPFLTTDAHGRPVIERRDSDFAVTWRGIVR